MNTQFHTPSFGDDIFDVGDASTSTPTTATGVLGGNLNDNAFTYQQQTPTSSQQATSTPNNVVPPPAVNVTPTSGLTTMAARKQMLPLDQNEPAKPLSAYALFFRDTVSAIKHQNPTCSFQELSKIVASMWDALDPVHKSVYNKKNELAKTEYIKQMRIYQQQQQQQQQQTNANSMDTTAIQQHQPQQQTVAAATNIAQQPQQNIQIPNNNTSQNTTNTAGSATLTPNTAGTSGTPSGVQNSLPLEAGSLQKCTRENCNKRAIINPDWEDEYCSNECVIIHCRNVFNAWVQSNLEAKQQQQAPAT